MAKTCFLGSVTVAAPSTGSSPRSTTRWRAPGLFDFGDRTFVPVVREEARALATDRTTWHVPHFETLFVQRKISGTALLGARLKARVDVRGMAAKATGRPVD